MPVSCPLLEDVCRLRSAGTDGSFTHLERWSGGESWTDGGHSSILAGPIFSSQGKLGPHSLILASLWGFLV